MYGGDWHVSELAGTYPQWVEIVEWVVEGATPAEKRKLFRDNAIRFYRLDRMTAPVPRWQRRAYSVEAMRALARAQLPRPVFDFADGGAEDEQTLRRNEAAFDEIELLPRPLSGAAKRDLSITCSASASACRSSSGRPAWPACSGRTASAAPRAPRQRPAPPSASATARSARWRSWRRTGAAPRWMQVFIYKDRGFTRELAERAAKAGYDALVLTIDNQLLGNRERDIRNGFSIPPRFGLSGLAGMALKAEWLWRMRRDLKRITFGNYVRPGEAADLKTLAGRMASLLDPVDVVAGRRRPAQDLDRPAAPQGHPASRRGAHGGGARHRRRDRLQPRRPPARRRGRPRSMRCRLSSMRSAAASRS